ncbi:MAG: hypothetical protein V3R16_00695 [Nitrospirales bacterium]
MFKLVGFLVVLGGGFALGYYTGQHRIDDLQNAMMSMSRTVLDSAMGMGVDRDLEWRGGLIQAKANVVEAKSELVDRNYGNASRELGKALDSLQAASRAERAPEQAAAARDVATMVRRTKDGLANGKAVPRSRLNDIQREIDSLLAR